MFKADERRNFLDLLRPPPGYRLEAAVGTTFSLDFVPLTATLLALVDAEEESESDKSSHTRIDSLHAITRLADRVRVFVSRGKITGPHIVSRAMLLYDRIVRDVSLPEGCFHPKVWVTYYLPRKRIGSDKLRGLIRVICSSRNLTGSTYWEAFVVCEGQDTGKSVTSKLNKEVGGFLRRLAQEDSESAPIIARLQKVLGRTLFAFPGPMRESTDFLWQWNQGPQLWKQLPKGGQRALLVSPFVRKTFLKDILERVEKLILVSTQRELDAIDDEEFMARLCATKNRVYVVEPVSTDEGGEAMDLHAKILIFEDPGNTVTFLGSANASDSAWRGRNCEAMLKFAPGVSIDRFCDDFIFGEKPDKPGTRRPLRGWISEYHRKPFEEDEVDDAKKLVDEICDYIGRLIVRGTFEPETASLRIFLEAPPKDVSAKFDHWALSSDLEVGLLSQLGQNTALQPLRRIADGEITFAGVGIVDLTEFLVVQVMHRKTASPRRMILRLKADFSQWRKQRDAQLLQELLTRDSLRNFLQAILFDAAARPPIPHIKNGGKGKGSGFTPSLLSDLTIEEVILSCTEDPSRIDEITQLLKAFNETDLIDDDFRKFWANFTEAVAQARKDSKHG